MQAAVRVGRSSLFKGGKRRNGSIAKRKAMLLILVGKWVLIWWVRKLTHPTGEVAMGSWWVREAYPPYKTLGSP